MNKRSPAYIVDDLVEELHRVAAEHERYNAVVNSATELGEIDIVHAGSVSVIV